VRILYFSDNLSVHNRRFLEKLTCCGHELYFLSISDAAVQTDWPPGGVQHIRPRRTFRRDADPGQVEQFLPEWRALLRDVQPDLVHAGPVQNCAYIAALSGFHPLLVASWASDILLHAERNADWRYATETALREADGLLCDSETVRAAAQRIVPIPNDRIAQFPWGLGRGAFSPHGPACTKQNLGFPADSFVFICTRSWEPEYGIDNLLEAFLRACRIDNRMRLIMIGSGSQQSQICHFISEHGLSRQILTPGIISGNEVPRWFRAADAYVSCAKSDGTSISLLEAMATGLPPIVTDNLSNREWVVDGENGWLAPADSPENLAEKLLLVAKLSAADRNTISATNRKIVADRADWDKNFPRLLQLYDRLLAHQPMVHV
jgi:L-malate glycosyltransferase